VAAHLRTVAASSISTGICRKNSFSPDM
jgi:hypothetical protein